MKARQSFSWLNFRSVTVLTTFIGVMVAPLLAQADPFFAVTPQINGNPGTLWRLEDHNGDNDALDPGEKIIFRDTNGTGLLTGDFVDVAASRSGLVYAVESDGRILKLRDVNQDGDAQDPGETSVFRDDTAQGFRLKSALSIAVSRRYDLDTKQLRDVVYVSDPQLQATVKLEDIDGDGNAQDVMEICLYHESTTSKPLTVQQMATDALGRLLAVNPNNSGSVLRLFDFNQDCTVIPPTREACQPDLLSNEYFVVKDGAGVSTDLMDPFGVAVTPEDVVFVSDVPDTQERARIVRLEDLTGDADAQDSAEVTVFSNGVCEMVDVFSAPTALAVDGGNALYVADYHGGKIFRLEDLDKDNTALKPGECQLFATGLPTLTGLTSQPAPLPPLAINLFAPEIEDLGKGPDLLLPPGETKTFIAQVVNAKTDAPQLGIKVACDSLAGCIECQPRTAITDAKGVIEFTVSWTSGDPLEGEGSLAVSIEDDVRRINVIPNVP